LEQLAFQRALFGFFPCYRDSPLAPHWNRIVPVGDSSGNQSPLSFGGFGAMLRHLSRLTDGMHEALQTDSLSQADLSFLQPYQPNLAVTWLFQRSMSAAVDRTLAPDQINQLLVAVFDAMQQAGPRVLNPFLQDVVQFPKLAEALFRTSLLHPGIIAKVIPQVGLPALLDWSRHYTALGAYSVLHPLAQAIAPWLEKQSLVRGSPSQQYRWHQRVQAWKYGSGRDYSE
jgi:lycopene cyclase CruP